MNKTFAQTAADFRHGTFLDDCADGEGCGDGNGNG